MGEAKVTLRLDISEALDSLRKVKGEAKNVSSSGGRGPGSKSALDDAIKTQKALGANLAGIERAHGQAIAENRRRDAKAIADKKTAMARLYKFELAEIERNEKARERLQRQTSRDRERLQKQNERNQIRVLKEVERLERKAERDKERALRHELSLIKQQEKARRDAATAYSQHIDKLANRGSGGFLGSTFQAGLTRVGGMGGSTIGGVARNAITGGFLGYGPGVALGSTVRSIGINAGNAIGGIGGLGIAGISGALGTGLPIYGALKGAQVGATFSIAQQGFSAAVNVFSGAARMLAGVVSGVLSRAVGIIKGFTLAGVAGAVGITGAGINAFGEKVKAETGLRVVGGAYAPSLANYGNALAAVPGQMFSRTSILQGITKASAFGMSPGLIRFFMPKMMNAASIFGEDTAEGMRALARAAFQAEPEAAERFGLNLYERNIKQMTGNRFNLNDPNQKAMATFETAAMQLRKFSGGMRAIRNTPGGAFQYVKNKGLNLLEEVGGGFAQGFQLVPRLNQMGDLMGQDKTKSATYRVARGVGALVGKGVDFISSKMPSLSQVGEFFSAKDEKTKASEWGDSFKSGLASIYATARSIYDIVKDIVHMLTVQLGAGLKAVMQDFWGSMALVQQQIVSIVNSIHNAVGQAAVSTTKQQAASFAQSTWNWIKQNPLTAAGTAIGAAGGFIAGLPIGMPLIGAGIGAAGGGTIGAGAQAGWNWLVGSGNAAQAQSVPGAAAAQLQGQPATWQALNVPSSWTAPQTPVSNQIPIPTTWQIPSPTPYQNPIGTQNTMSGNIAAGVMNAANTGISSLQGSFMRGWAQYPNTGSLYKQNFQQYKQQALGWINNAGSTMSNLMNGSPRENWDKWQATLQQQKMAAQSFRRTGDWLGTAVNRYGPNADIIGGMMGVPRGPVSAYQQNEALLAAQQEDVNNVAIGSTQAPQRGVFNRKNFPRRVIHNHYGNNYYNNDSHQLMKMAEAI